MSIKINNISKSFGNFQALTNINLEINSGELVALLGPSGSGKTSLLRIIAGLEEADAGNIYFNNVIMNDINAVSRKVGFVFQHYALFNHMSVKDNISYGLRVRPFKERPKKQEINDKVKELLSLVRLEGLENRYPMQLSGGQRQRVALARALAVEPKVLLLDEPFGALDAKVRKDLRRWLRKLHDEVHVTSVFVTHDQEEALDVSDRIVVMNNGEIEQIGTPNEVYEEPKTPFVYNFLGNVNVFKGRFNNGMLHVKNQQIAATHYGERSENEEAVAFARPHQMAVYKNHEKGSILATIYHIHSVGPIVFLELRWNETDDLLQVELPREQFNELSLSKGDIVYVLPQNIKLFSPEEYSI
ncbi:sulfate/molybdate ABC transporter ATP-binding protein [Halalkalibacter hemicellulosilyticus]|uniref:Sulfate and thiosulfate import ATP-binding protein CysA n=1 Tax=Halalkalibacter hemicellulosilyticusJCM 9152 TaxID=1236971 RepID=W4QBR9_9BACI|nr:sulfate/molybdate ABC transporter ATP-binding protein [Halalkalibacter hemicellulosilyticus]GAE28844.1 sulfate and thiosulfate import ATP-binding protein CysA [Halalkalibacter hemicellulosilyticusJCM 9152]